MGRSAYFRVMFLLFGGAGVICGVCRICLKLFHTSPENGFYTASTPLIPILNYMLLAVILIMMAINRLKAVDGDYPVQREGRAMGLSALLVGVSLVLYTLENTGWRTLTPSSGMPLEGIPVYIVGVAGMLGALAFVFMGIYQLLGGISPPGVIALVPSLWQMIILVCKYNSYTTLTTIMDNLLAVLFMVFNAMFLIGNARTICGFARKDGRNYIIPTGLITALLGFLLVIPNYVCMFFDRTMRIPAPSLGWMESIFVFFMSVYALCSVIRLRRSIALV